MSFTLHIRNSAVSISTSFFFGITEGNKLQEQLKPLVEQLNRVKDLSVPDFGTLQAWEVRASAAARAAAGDNPNDPSRSYQSGTPMPFLGDPKVSELSLLNQYLCALVLLCNFWFHCLVQLYLFISL